MFSGKENNYKKEHNIFIFSDGPLWVLLCFSILVLVPLGHRMTIPQALVWASKDILTSELDLFPSRKLAYLFHRVAKSHLCQQISERGPWRVGDILFPRCDSSVMKLLQLLCNCLSSYSFPQLIPPPNTWSPLLAVLAHIIQTQSDPLWRSGAKKNEVHHFQEGSKGQQLQSHSLSV